MANVKMNQLSVRGIEGLKVGVHTDGGGLSLRVHPSGRSWVMRVTVDGKRRQLGLGAFPEVMLAEARRRASEMRRRVRAGLPPREASTDEPTTPTFAEVAVQVIELREPTWTSPRHATQWRESLRLHVFPLIGENPVDTITTTDMMDVLTPIWNVKSETAGRIKQRMATVFDYAIARTWRTDNPCNGAVQAALPPRSRQRRHFPALPYDEIAEALVLIFETTARPEVKLGLEFLVLTATRAGEVRQARWGEVDFEDAIWEKPAEHMKMREKHRVPLSSGALDVLDKTKALSKRRGDGLIFPSNRGRDKMLTNMAFTMLLRRAGFAHITTHGFRATFRTWALEQTDTPWAVAEAALAHKLGGGEVSPYIRGDQLERRRTLMQSWSDFVLAP